MSEYQNRLSNGPIHVTKVPVRWGDFDRFGHINNAAYIELAQESRAVFAMEEFVAHGHQFPAAFIRTMQIDYLSAVMPDTLEVIVETQVTQIGRSSFTTVQNIKDRHGNIACVIECVQIAVDLKTSRPRPLSALELKIMANVSSREAALSAAEHTNAAVNEHSDNNEQYEHDEKAAHQDQEHQDEAVRPESAERSDS